ncbi:L-seryl-tRNA(Sec) selenium transferase [Enterococcus sp. CSURQ0835]|uniref:L-seryl-tRNA(Sec) selenium transferase n=1 Tax=Enterococcus sp. CSURQ0835 TaxID=2681394 RepID=UPI001358C136|nr:L-seryl-tRNA(Sec) selenium transferase [Enterococcus sp. CSURQ0835]
MANPIQQILAQLPAVDECLKWEALRTASETYSHQQLKDAIQTVLNQTRQRVLAGELDQLPAQTVIAATILDCLQAAQKFSLQRVINGTGTVLHTNLGRSVLSPAVQQQVEQTAFHYSNLEFELATGKRGSRYEHLTKVIQTLTGAEDVLVVNNNAAAVLLVLSTLAPQQEVLVSRGELVEIGGAFRIPEVITAAGGVIREVGTTNKTHLADYAAAFTDTTGALLKVHTSNYRIVGFTESVPLPELAALAKEKAVPLVNDLGSGLLLDMRRFGLPYEPTVKECLAQGCDVVTFSGDKLLGGPQAGIIVGKRVFIEQMKKNQLLRALRIDKMTLAALEATLQLYLTEDVALKEIPVLKMLAQTAEECRQKAEHLATLIKQAQLKLSVTVSPDTSAVGGGSYPEHLLPTFVVSLEADQTAEKLQTLLRSGELPIISRIKNERNLLDVRTIDESEFVPLVAQLKKIMNEPDL